MTRFAFRSALLLWLALGALSGMAQIAAADNKDYKPSTFPAPVGDQTRFPAKTDLKIWTDAFNSLNQLAEKKRIGLDIAKTYTQAGKGKIPHPWTFGNPNGQTDYIQDNLAILNLTKFMDCFEPRIHDYGTAKFNQKCSQHCPPIDEEQYWWGFCNWNKNSYLLEYWWPETIVEINNYGIASFTPVLGGRVDLMKQALEQTLKLFYEKKRTELGDRFPEKLPLTDYTGESAPNIGQSHWDGLLPSSQVWQGEAHAYRSMVALSTMRLAPRSIWGYQVDPRCFYDSTFGPGPGGMGPYATIHGWTEQPGLLPVWRSEAASMQLDPALYKASLPQVEGGVGGLKKYLNDKTLALNYLSGETCASYRVKKWPTAILEGSESNLGKGYSDLTPALGIQGNSSDALDKICYFGGGQLFPVTGQLMGNYSSLVAAAYLARRAIYLMSHESMMGGLLGFGMPGAGAAGQLGGLQGQLTEMQGAVNQVQGLFGTLGIGDFGLGGISDSLGSAAGGLGELAGGLGGLGGFGGDSIGIRISKYNDKVDKMQRVYPRKGSGVTGFLATLPSGCFKTNEIDEYSNEPESAFLAGLLGDPSFSAANPRFPKDLVRPEHLGSIRYVYWNKRESCQCSCFGYPNGCTAVDSGDSYDNGGANGIKGWRMGIPYPFGMGAG